MTTRAAILVTLAQRLDAGLTPVAAQDGTTRTFNAPVDRVYTVARSVLKSLGWDIDEEDAGRCTDTVELRVDKEEDIEPDDRAVEKQILDEIGRSL